MSFGERRSPAFSLDYSTGIILCLRATFKYERMTTGKGGQCRRLTGNLITAAIVAFADTVVRADRVAAERTGRAPMSARPARALVRVDAAPPRQQRSGGGGGERGVVRPEAVPTAAEISTGNVDAFGGHRVAGRHALGTLVHVCSQHIFTFFSSAKYHV